MACGRLKHGVSTMNNFEPKSEMTMIHGRFVRLFLEHKDEAGLASLSDEQVVERAPEIFKTLMEVYVEAWRKRDKATRNRLAWFTRACDEEFDETHLRPAHRPLH
jgi:hypothetical protein